VCARERVQFLTGCSAYLTKPFSPDELLSIVNNLLVQKTRYASKVVQLQERIEQLTNLLNGTASANASAPPPAPTHASLYGNISAREYTVLELLTGGWTNKEISGRVGVSVRSVERYVNALMQKTQTHTRTDLVRYALEHDIVQQR
jgi:DNA-binding NarL/FixJ family response regulator